MILINTGASFEGLNDDQGLIVLLIPLCLINFIGIGLCILYIDDKGRRALLLRSTPLLVFGLFIIATGVGIYNYEFI